MGDFTQHNRNRETYSIALWAWCSSNPSFSRHTLKTRWAWITRRPTWAWASLKQIKSKLLSIHLRSIFVSRLQNMLCLVLKSLG